MSKRTFSAAVAVLVAILAYLAVTLVGQDEAYVAPVQGKNNTALFVVLPHHGLSNVHLATAQALMERHPQIKMEFLSFPKIAGKVKRMSDLGLASNPKAQPIGFRKLHGRNYDDVLAEVVGTDGIEGVLTLPGLKGIDKFCRDLQMYVSPWPAEEHYEIFSEIAQVINETDPAVVVLDSIFAPAIDATRESKRLHSIISPNTIVDIFAAKQPWGGMFWKYPMMGAGFKFPLPWYNIPSNAYQVARLVARMLYTPDVTAKKKYLMEKGLKNPINFFKMHHEDAPWITQTMEGASVPVEVIPRNVSAVGPIVISVASAEEQDPKMHAWLAKGPTILVNLGSSVTYSQVRATAMVQGMKQVLDQTDVQILWKFRKAEEYSDDFLAPVKDYLASGRLRLEKWLTVDPTSILESGHVVAFVHHGGANCYHEGVYAGVPHIILPLWVDLYNFAALVETFEIGVWGCPKTSPYWSGECIGDAILKVVDGGEKSKAMRENARSLGEAAKKTPGRYGAAETIAQLAGSGY